MPPADDPLPDLIRALRGHVAEPKARAAKAIGRLGRLARDTLPLLVSSLHDPDPTVREAAAWAVGQMGPDALNHLLAMLRHEDKYVRRNAVWALAKLGPPALKAIPHLCEALKDADPRTASGAAQALGNMGEEAADAVPDLIEAMRGTNIVLCRLAAKALSQVGRPALPPLIGNLRHRDPFVRGEAALALGWMGPMAATAIPGLIEIIRDTQPAAAAPAAVGSRTPATAVAPNPPAAPAEDSSRVHAIQALGRIGPAAASALPLLQAAVKEPNEQVRTAARTAIRQIQKV